MATAYPQVRYFDETNVWREIIGKEQSDKKNHLMRTGNGFRSVSSRYDKSRPKSQYKTYGNMKIALKEGLMRPETVNDAPKHHSDPPYVVIKPQYRAHLPLPNFN